MAKRPLWILLEGNLHVIINFSICIILLMLLDALLVVSSQDFQADSIVASNGADRVDNVDRVGSE